MFDGLKKKFSSFREDVEETAEEKAAESDAESEIDPETDAGAGDADLGPEPEAATGVESDAVAGDSADSAGGTASDADAAAGTGARGAEPETGIDAGASDPETDPVKTPSPDASAADSPDAGTAAEGADVEAESAEADERSGRSAGRLKRAKAFATGRIIIEEEDLEEPLWQLEMALLESDVEMDVAERILRTIREKMVGESRKQVDTTAELVHEALHDALLDVISVGQFDFDARVAEAEKPVTIIFTGVNGVGKTTTIAKLSEYFEERGLSTVLANGDTYRAGANEQIREHAENLDRRLISHEQGGDPAAVLYDALEYAEAHDVDVVLGDTAGRLHTNKDLMAQLEKIDRVVDPDMTLFVDEAVAGQDAVQRAKQFNDAAETDGTILTKADADSQGGAAISIAYVTGKPILFLGTGQGYDDLEQFDPEALVESLLGDEE